MVFVRVSARDVWSLDHTSARHEETRGLLESLARQAIAPFSIDAPDDPAFPRNPGHCSRCTFDTLCNSRSLEATGPESRLARFALVEGGD
jgi:hypothetical protein